MSLNACEMSANMSLSFLYFPEAKPYTAPGMKRMTVMVRMMPDIKGDFPSMMEPGLWIAQDRMIAEAHEEEDGKADGGRDECFGNSGFLLRRELERFLIKLVLGKICACKARCMKRSVTKVPTRESAIQDATRK